MSLSSLVSVRQNGACDDQLPRTPILLTAVSTKPRPIPCSEQVPAGKKSSALSRPSYRPYKNISVTLRQRRSLFTEAQVRSRVSPCGICDREQGIGRGFFPITAYTANYHPTNCSIYEGKSISYKS